MLKSTESFLAFLRYRISRPMTVRRDTDPAVGTMIVGRSGVTEMCCGSAKSSNHERKPEETSQGGNVLLFQ